MAAEKTKKYKTLMTVRHDGKGYVAGATLELTAAQAKPLLEIKAIAELAAKEAE